MPQSFKPKKKKATKSAGSLRKQVGVSAKHKPVGKNKNRMREKATSSYINAVESSMASKLPSDQRDKLTIVRGGGVNPSATKKHQKKPLTRGRKRK